MIASLGTLPESHQHAGGEPAESCQKAAGKLSSHMTPVT